MAELSLPIAPIPRVGPYKIREANLDQDGSEIVRLCKAGALNCSVQKYRWKYELNVEQRPWCELAVETVSEHPVGTTALFPRRLLVDGNRFSAAVAGDFAVEPGHRTLYPALALQKAALQACRDGRFDVLYGFPNDAARLVQLRAGYLSAGHVRAGIRPLRARCFLDTERRLGWWGHSADLLDAVVQLATRQSREELSEEYAYLALTQTCQRFDDFWARALSQYRILVEKNSSYVNWRFMQCPYKHYHLFAAEHRKTGEIGGYIVWYVSDDGKVRISDLMAFDSVFKGLLSAFIRMQQAQGATCITVVYFGNDRLIRQLRSFGFFFRQTRSQVLLSVGPGVPEPARLFDRSNWYLFDGDSDS